MSPNPSYQTLCRPLDKFNNAFAALWPSISNDRAQKCDFLFISITYNCLWRDYICKIPDKCTAYTKRRHQKNVENCVARQPMSAATATDSTFFVPKTRILGIWPYEISSVTQIIIYVVKTNTFKNLVVLWYLNKSAVIDIPSYHVYRSTDADNNRTVIKYAKQTPAWRLSPYNLVEFALIYYPLCTLYQKITWDYYFESMFIWISPHVKSNIIFSLWLSMMVQFHILSIVSITFFGWYFVNEIYNHKRKHNTFRR